MAPLLAAFRLVMQAATQAQDGVPFPPRGFHLLLLHHLRHPGPACERFVIEGNASEVVVQYTCRGRGYGRTEIRRETGRLVQIDSRGIANGLPFEFSAEARRIGNCGGT